MISPPHDVLGAVDGELHLAAHHLDGHGARRGVIGEHLAGVEGELHDPHDVVGDKDPRGGGLGQDRQRIGQIQVGGGLWDGGRFLHAVSLRPLSGNPGCAMSSPSVFWMRLPTASLFAWWLFMVTTVLDRMPGLSAAKTFDPG
jgi:hypothetical protein